MKRQNEKGGIIMRKMKFKGNAIALENETIRITEHRIDHQYTRSRLSEIPIIMNTTSSKGE